MNTTTQPHARPARGVRMARTFIKPGWVIAVIAILGFSYLAFTLLAPWQLGKDHDITQRNERIDAAARTAPVPVTDIFDTHGAITPENEWRQVRLTGHYLPEAESVLRMRPVDGGPAIQALTPFTTTTGTTYLINRGYVSTRGAEVPDFAAPPSGQVTIEGVARQNEATPDREPFTENGRLQVYGINTDYIGQAAHVTLAHDFIQLTDSQPGVLKAMPIPKLDRGSHLSYGLQWIAFGIMAPLGLGYFIWAEMRERRRVDAETAELDATEAASTGLMQLMLGRLGRQGRPGRLRRKTRPRCAKCFGTTKTSPNHPRASCPTAHAPTNTPDA
ncbi:SURF1 family cytochrome oxidase biogenesis protein [Corynebacterium sp. Marseille-Q2516]